MFWFGIKKEVKKSFSKVKSHISKNKADIDSNKIKIARLEGAISVLLNNSKSQSQPVSKSLRKSQGNIETKVINKIRRSKKTIVASEIKNLMGNHSVIEMYNVLVLEKGLCSKATFYRYIAGLKKSQKLIVRQE